MHQREASAFFHESLFRLFGQTDNPSTPTAINYLDYENSAYGVKIKYPSNWEKTHENESYGAPFYIIAAFQPPSSNSQRNFVSGIQITQMDFSSFIPNGETIGIDGFDNSWIIMLTQCYHK